MPEREVRSDLPTFENASQLIDWLDFEVVNDLPYKPDLLERPVKQLSLKSNRPMSNRIRWAAAGILMAGILTGVMLRSKSNSDYGKRLADTGPHYLSSLAPSPAPS